jgi:hypothetical protein
MQVAFRLPNDLFRRLDAYVELRSQQLGFRLSRTQVACALLAEALTRAEGKKR